MSDFNQQIIEEFRANDGKVGGPFEGSSLLLLNTVGAKSGEPRTSPLAYVMDGDHYVIAASKGGAPSNPDWYYNLLKQPVVELEVGDEIFPAQATIFADGPERDRLYAKMVAAMPGFAEYERKTDRIIPVVALEPITA